MNPFLQRIQASVELERSFSNLSCTRFLPKKAFSTELKPSCILSALKKIPAGIRLRADQLRFSLVSSVRMECFIKHSNVRSSHALEVVADTLGSALSAAGWWRLEVVASLSPNETRISLIRRPTNKA